ncbi:MAG: hypothetical protein STHCBS139747_006699 [Sporothrix thermara]
MTERWVAESQQLSQAEESAENALEEAFARLRRIRRQQKVHEEKRKRLLDEAYAAWDAEDEARWADE